MNSSAQPSRWDSTTTARLIRWMFRQRTIRRFLLTTAWIITFVALFYGEENWRGRHAWDKYRRELEVRGEQLDYGAFIPKPVPNEQNFAATPSIQSWFPKGAGADKLWGTNFLAAEKRISDSKLQGHRGDRHFRDLIAWQNSFTSVRTGKLKPRTFESDQLDLDSRAKAAPAILEELKITDPLFAELRAASQRPYARYPLFYDLDNPWGILLPHLANIKRGMQTLSLKACAELALGRGETALEDVQLMLFLADSVKEEPFLISSLVRMSCIQIAASAVWEGLAEQTWSENQLHTLQTIFERDDFVVAIKKSLAAERAGAILTVDLLRERKYRFGELFDDDSHSLPHFVDVIGQIVPRGWYYFEQLNYCRLFHARFETKMDPTKRRIFTNGSASETDGIYGVLAVDRGENSRGTVRLSLQHRLIGMMLLPGLGNAPYKAAMAQVTIDQVALACALERYRLANQQFPENLEALMPRFISVMPHDVLTGERYKYRRAEDGQFVLYSVGWNLQDEGGVPGKTLFDETNGDWVWRYPQKQ